MAVTGQGAQDTSGQFRRLPPGNGITCTMSGAGNVRHNPALQGISSSLKTAPPARNLARARNAARADVFDCIGRLHNPRRHHSQPGHHSPVVFGDRAFLA